MTTLLLTHPACLQHETPPGHPERSDRLRAVAQVLGEDRFDKLARGEAPEGNLELVGLCHDPHYIDELRHVAPTSGLIYLDGDTSMSPGTWQAVMRGVGGAVAATDAVMGGDAANAFVATRPPGHHAETNKPMGSASSTTSPSPPVTPSANTASLAPRWWISTSITATAPRKSSGPTQP
jgi:acetoin utilization deacetylase AcuC-like enzyme